VRTIERRDAPNQLPIFVSKMEGALQELDETTYWLEVLREAGLVSGADIERLAVEANELISIFVSTVKQAKLTCQGAA
jgi:four helix bundle protein